MCDALHVLKSSPQQRSSVLSHPASTWEMVVNLLQVHAYTACPNDQTAYLAELKSGKEVLVVNAEGQQRSAIVGRVKIETRPLVGAVTLQQQAFWVLVLQTASVLLCIPVTRGTRWLTLPLNILCFTYFRDVAGVCMLEGQHV